MQKALASSADAIIFDLEDSVAADRRVDARKMAAATIDGSDRVWVRINPLDSEEADLDLETLLPAAPAGIILPKPESAADAIDLAARLAELEPESEQGRTRIVCICTEKPEALFTLGGYKDATERLAGLSWGAEDLSAAVGATTNRGPDGAWLAPYQLARSMCLFAAAAAGVPAIDTVYTDFRNEEGLRQYAAHARRDGFSGMLAIHPAQVEIINRAFAPRPDEIQRARRIVQLFADNPGAGVLGMDGEMIDRPHVVQAERILELANAIARKEQT